MVVDEQPGGGQAPARITQTGQLGAVERPQGREPRAPDEGERLTGLPRIVGNRVDFGAVGVGAIDLCAGCDRENAGGHPSLTRRTCFKVDHDRAHDHDEYG